VTVSPFKGQFYFQINDAMQKALTRVEEGTQDKAPPGRSGRAKSTPSSDPRGRRAAHCSPDDRSPKGA
jgi:hypothetical protein